MAVTKNGDVEKIEVEVEAGLRKFLDGSIVIHTVDVEVEVRAEVELMKKGIRKRVANQEVVMIIAIDDVIIVLVITKTRHLKIAENTVVMIHQIDETFKDSI
jgi:hypothetical protein